MYHLIHLHIESHIREAIAFYVAAISAVGGLVTAGIGAVVELPPGTERLLDLGFAGLFIIALLYALRIVWVAKEDIQKRYDLLEREVRESLVKDLKEANATRSEMIDLMRRKEGRDLTEHP